MDDLLDDSIDARCIQSHNYHSFIEDNGTSTINIILIIFQSFFDHYGSTGKADRSESQDRYCWNVLSCIT